MASRPERCSGNRRQSSRLQRRAPASIEINPVKNWNVAIPLLSPLDASPVERPVEMIKSNRDDGAHKISNSHQGGGDNGMPPVFKKWQHPAVPFCYEAAPRMQFSFLPV